MIHSRFLAAVAALTMLVSNLPAAARAGDNDRAMTLNANCIGCDMSHRDLHGRDLHGVHYIGTDLSGSDLHAVDLHDAKLVGVDLSGANLEHSNLTNGTFTGVDFRGASLTGVLADGARVTGAELGRIRFRGRRYCRTPRALCRLRSSRGRSHQRRYARRVDDRIRFSPRKRAWCAIHRRVVTRCGFPRSAPRACIVHRRVAVWNGRQPALRTIFRCERRRCGLSQCALVRSSARRVPARYGR